jgi:predicted PurR-regulated permease PerM
MATPARPVRREPPPPAEQPNRPDLTAAEPEAPVISAPTDVRRVAMTVVAVLAAVFALQYAQAFLIPIVVAILIAYGLDPIVSAVTRLKVPRAAAAGLVVFAVAVSGGLAAYSMSDEAVAIVQQAPEAAQKLRQMVRTMRRGTTAIDQVQRAAKELEKTAAEATGATPPPAGVTRVQIEQPTFDGRDYLVWGSMGLVAIAGQLTLLMFLVFFLLASGDTYKRKVVKIAGKTLSQKKVTVEILDDINQQIERFLLVQAFTSVLVGVASYVVFRWFGLNHPGIWALAAGLFNSIPYLGPIVVTVGVFAVALLQFENFAQPFAVSIAALVVTSLEGMLLTPWLTSRAAQMNAVAVFIGLLFWSWVWGVWGMLLAVPMLMVFKAICDRVEDLKPVGELLGE